MSNSTTIPPRNDYGPCPACGQEWDHGFVKSPYSEVLLAPLTENKRLKTLLRTLVTTLKVWLDSTAEVETPETDQRRAMMLALGDADRELLR